MSKHVCNHIRTQLPDWLDGRLGERDAELVRGHLASCEDCRKEAERLRPLMQDLLPAARDRHADVDWGAFLARVNEGIDHRTGRPRSKYGIDPALALAAATVVFLLLAAWVVFQPFSRGTTDDPILAEDILAPHEVESLESLSTEQALEIPNTMTTDVTNTDALGVIASDAVPADDDALLALANEEIVDALGAETAVNASVQYLTSEQVLDALSDADVTMIASLLESEQFLSD